LRSKLRIRGKNRIAPSTRRYSALMACPVSFPGQGIV
jgi:hypothetical protein